MRHAISFAKNIAVAAFAVLLAFVLCIVMVGMFNIVMLGCGTERWQVKTLADADAGEIDQRPTIVTVAQLTQGAAPARADMPADHRLSFSAGPSELKVYSVTALLVGFKKEGDEDLHIVLADISNPRVTMVAEMPSPGCMPAEYRSTAGNVRLEWEKRFGKATAKFKDVHQHKIRVQFIGVGFYDFIHGQTGVAKNGFELHPVLAWQEVFAKPESGEIDARMQFLPVRDAAMRGTEFVHADAFFLFERRAALYTFQAPKG